MKKVKSASYGADSPRRNHIKISRLVSEKKHEQKNIKVNDIHLILMQNPKPCPKISSNKYKLTLFYCHCNSNT